MKVSLKDAMLQVQQKLADMHQERVDYVAFDEEARRLDKELQSMMQKSHRSLVLVHTNGQAFCKKTAQATVKAFFKSGASLQDVHPSSLWLESALDQPSHAQQPQSSKKRKVVTLEDYFNVNS